MDQFNKAISFFLGLIVVVVFLAVATGKINLKGKTLPFLKGATVTVTPTPTAEVVGAQNKPTPTIKQNSQYRTYSSSVNTASTIPSTGPELLLPLVISTFFGGSFLRKMSQKK